MSYDAIVIGSGLSGLAAASLLAKRGLKIAVIEQAFKPGGSCGIFKRDGVIFDQGSAMLFGFGEEGFNSHRFLFNLLEEPIDMVKHRSLYTVYFNGKRIEFHYDIDRFIEELAQVFPEEKDNLKRFYADLGRLYDHVIAETPVFSTPDEVDPKDGLKQAIRHPLSYLRFLSYMNLSTKDLLKRYFSSDDILLFFNKLTSTYCYTNVEETPAVLAAVMFVENHRGGSFYPAGSTIHVPGILEKVIEENGGDMLYGERVVGIDIEGNEAKGVTLTGGRKIEAESVIFSGTVWDLYDRLIDSSLVSPERRQWVAKIKPSYPSSILYAVVKKEAIPRETTPITFFTENVAAIDDNDVTAYIFSIDDQTICPPEYHAVMAIGPTFKKWPAYSPDYESLPEYIDLKDEEEERLLSVMEKRFPGFRHAVVHKEVSTPLTIERYTAKRGGSVAGPLQSMGQHMLNRQHIKSDFLGLYCCGESTVMGTGAPAVTVSGITAANAILKQKGLAPYLYRKGMKNFVRVFEPPYRSVYAGRFANEPPAQAALRKEAGNCQLCEIPTCMRDCSIDIRGINRRLVVGNYAGAARLLRSVTVSQEDIAGAEASCILTHSTTPVKVADIIHMLDNLCNNI